CARWEDGYLFDYW
nr:immunoglobulin heavy chain junction region [Mus musculus]